MVDVGAIAQAGASTLDTYSNVAMSYAQTRANIDMAREARNWSAQQAANRHQVEVADLKKAGINPILTATGGQGAPMPQTTVPEVTMPKLNMGEMYLNYGKLIADIQNSKADTAAKNALTEKTTQEAITETTKQGLNSALSSQSNSQLLLNQNLSEKTRKEIEKTIVDTSVSSAMQKKLTIENAVNKLELQKQQNVKPLYDQKGSPLPFIEAMKDKSVSSIVSGLLLQAYRKIRNAYPDSLIKPK